MVHPLAGEMYMSQTNLGALSGHLWLEVHHSSSPQSVELEPKGLLISEVPFSSENASSRKFPAKEPRDEVEETDVPPEGFTIRYFYLFFIVCSFSGLSSTL